MGMGLKNFKVVSLTEAAAERVKEIMADAETPILGVRVGVRNGGCAGMAYTMDYVTTPEPSDDVIEDKGVRLFIERKASLFLFGTVMDFTTSKLASGFVFNNPNQVSACGCGESVALKAAELPAAGA